MRRFSSQRSWPAFFLFLALGQAMGGEALAAPPVATNAPARPTSAATESLLPPPFVVKSPVDFFRELLAMQPDELSQALADRTEENRRLILAKVREYRRLKPNERELRLRATDLEWRLVPLMRLSATNRTAQLAALREEDRKLIEPRLQDWDRLPEGVRQDLLERRESIRLYIQMTSGASLTNALANTAGPRRVKLERELNKLQAMSEEERQQTLGHFNQFFELNPREKEKALRTLLPAEQEQIAKTLRKYEGLTAQQRVQCIRSYEQFAGMTSAERQQFLKNAERWFVMTPEQRNAWRQVVEKVSVIPPTFVTAPRPPPIPRSRKSQPVATNGS